MTHSTRLAWIDQLRAFLTILVVGHHAAQAYGPTGGSWPVGSAVRAPVLGVFISVNAMFFMSLFFFLSGYFVPATYARKGARAFLEDRMWRLGVPSLVVLVLTGIFMNRPQVLHLWFVVDLLALNVGYVAWQKWCARRRVDPPTTDAPVDMAETAQHGEWRVLLMTVAILTLGTALLRMRFAVDEWVNLLGILPIEPAHAMHYLAAFIAGIAAARARCLERASDRFGRTLFIVALVVVALYAFYRVQWSGAGGWFSGGGVSWSMLRLAGLESVLCVTLGGGLLWLFRTMRHAPSRFLGVLADDAFGIYCIHLPVVIVSQMAMVDVFINPLLKFVIVTVVSLSASWIVTRQVLRRLPLGRRIF